MFFARLINLETFEWFETNFQITDSHICDLVYGICKYGYQSNPELYKKIQNDYYNAINTSKYIIINKIPRFICSNYPADLQQFVDWIYGLFGDEYSIIECHGLKQYIYKPKFIREIQTALDTNTIDEYFKDGKFKTDDDDVCPLCLDDGSKYWIQLNCKHIVCFDCCVD